MLRESLSAFQEQTPPSASQIANAQSLLGALLTARARYDEAERLLIEAHDALLADQGAESRRTREARKRLAAPYDAWSKPAEAARWQQTVEPVTGHPLVAPD